MSAIIPIGLALLPHFAFGGAIFTGGYLALWVFKKTLYLLTDGPSVDRFRGLVSDIENCKAKLILHLETPRPAVGVFGDVSEASILTIEIDLLFDQIKRLSIPVPDFRPLSDQRQKSLWWPI